MRTAFTDAVTLKFEYGNYSEMLQKIQSLGLILQMNDFTKEFARLWHLLGKRATPNGYTAILHASSGLMYPITINRKQSTLKIEFYGLQQYCRESQTLNETAIFMRQDLEAFIRSDLTPQICGIDMCCDSCEPIKLKAQPRRTIRKVGGTIYANTKQVAKENYIRCYSYNKSAKNHLDYPLFRIEVSFLSSYFAKNNLDGLKKSFEKFVNFKVDFETLINMLRKT